MEKRGDFDGVTDAETDQRVDAKFGVEFARFYIDLFFGSEKSVEVGDEVRIDVEEEFVETLIELFQLVGCDRRTRGLVAEFFPHVCSGEASDGLAECLEFVDIGRAQRESRTDAFLFHIVGFFQSIVDMAFFSCSRERDSSSRLALSFMLTCWNCRLDRESL